MADTQEVNEHLKEMFDVGLLEDVERNLLYTIALFQGPAVPETIVRLVLRCTQPTTKWETVRLPMDRLEALKLVRLEEELVVPQSKYYENPKKWRAISIAGPLQQFILDKRKEDMRRITSFLDEETGSPSLDSRTDCDLATALCALYGTEYVKERAVKKFDDEFIWSDFEHLVDLSADLRLLVDLMLVEDGESSGSQSDIAVAAAETFLNVFAKGELDDDHVFFLLSESEAIVPICGLIRRLSHTFHETSHEIRVAALPRTLKRLFSLLSNDVEELCGEAVDTILSLVSSWESVVRVAKYPRALEALVRMLSDNVPVRIQENTMNTISNLAYTPQNKVPIFAAPGFMDRLLAMLSKDKGERSRAAGLAIQNLGGAAENRVPIAEFPGILEALVGLLEDDLTERIHAATLMAVATLALSRENHVPILAVPGMMERLVAHLSKDLGDRCRGASTAIRRLAVADENATLIAQFPGAMEALVGLMAEDVPKIIQRQAGGAIVNLLTPRENLRLIFERLDAVITEKQVAKTNHADLYRLKSYAKAGLKDFAGGLEDINKALEIDPKNGFYLRERGVLRRLMGDLVGAMADLNRALDTDPNNYDAFKHRGLVKFMLEDVEGAQADAQKAITIGDRSSGEDFYFYRERCLGQSPVEFLQFKLA